MMDSNSDSDDNDDSNISNDNSVHSRHVVFDIDANRIKIFEVDSDASFLSNNDDEDSNNDSMDDISFSIDEVLRSNTIANSRLSNQFPLNDTSMDTSMSYCSSSDNSINNSWTTDTTINTSDNMVSGAYRIRLM